jgi:hypothetical protein
VKSPKFPDVFTLAPPSLFKSGLAVIVALKVDFHVRTNPSYSLPYRLHFCTTYTMYVAYVMCMPFPRRPPDQTFALVLAPALTKMGDTFCVFLPSAVAPLWHPQNSRNGARAEGDKIKSGGAFFTLRCAPVLTFLGVALGLLEPFTSGGAADSWQCPLRASFD